MLKHVSITVCGEEEEDLIDLMSKRHGHMSKYPDDILEKVPYKKSFDRLTWKERRRQMDLMSEHILNCCVDQPQLRKYGIGYLRGNEYLTVTVLNFLDGVKEKNPEGTAGESFSDGRRSTATC